LGVPSMLHDANAVMGRANKLLAPRVDLVAMGFDGVGEGTVEVTGNPVRPAVIEAAKSAYPVRKAGEPFNLLVFGGSQGAQFFSQALPLAIELMTPQKRALLRVVQQARAEDEAALKADYARLAITAEIAPFFTDMAKKIANAHFVISRAGASTVSELAVIGRPALLVPYPHALDHDQALNAKAIADNGGATIFAQSALEPQRLAEILDEAVSDPQRLSEMAGKAGKSGHPDAAARLADCLEKLAAGRREKAV
ncbi:MAG TPA: UDP-N-acetylglucosamine--N-acetylmuramyl-(pentapeptide) pyrophosphoryl-undecaprenol N-acetylglucosamine transferase, partial [Rhizobiaceae bacterium]|nr:UDP-N-acetylglucosamine--N-acetylmuramyl-(pentapeptide) pyrophosphoryl-undecaprenol N-acetylglucosamine transferase [Rhizobiaceae bacterium]